MKDGKIAIVEEEAELVRSIYRRYLELGSVNELVRDLKKRNIRTRVKPLATGATRGGVPFGRGTLYYLLSNHFYIGEVKYSNEILPGEQPPIMDRALFDAVRQKSLAQWSHRTVVRNKSDHLLTGLLFDDAGHRMIPTHATKAGIRYRYYASTPVLHGAAKTNQVLRGVLTTALAPIELMSRNWEIAKRESGEGAKVLAATTGISVDAINKNGGVFGGGLSGGENSFFRKNLGIRF
jgi:hypothetical protein